MMSSTPESHGTSPPRAGSVLAVLCLAQFMVVLDASIVNVALPQMSAALAMPATELSLVVTGYALFFGALLLLGGRLGDRFGRRRVFVLGLLAFVAASLVGGLAWSGSVLIVARAAQGAAAAVLAPSVLALITTHFTEGPVRTRAIGVFGAVSAAGFSAGVLLGGILVQWLTWRAVLFVNVPVGLAVAVVTPWVVPRDDDTTSRRLDLPGALRATVGLAALVYALSRAPDLGWNAPTTFVLLGAAAVLLTTFVIIERRSGQPLLRLGLLRNALLSGANIVVLLFGATMISTLFVLTLYLQDGLHYSAIATGLALLPHALVVAVLAPAVSRLTARFGPSWPMATGAVLLIVGLGVLSRIGPADRFAAVVLPGTLVLGVGVATLTVAGAVAATTGVARAEQGIASGLFNTSQQLGGAVGLASLTSVIGGAAPIDGYRTALVVAIGFPAAALLIITAFGVRGLVTEARRS